jgi:hypothetical protein
MNAEDIVTVLTFTGQGGRRFHAPVRFSDAVRPLCGQTGRNPVLKERALIETHYEACQRCFADGRRRPPTLVTDRATAGGDADARR